MKKNKYNNIYGKISKFKFNKVICFSLLVFIFFIVMYINYQFSVLTESSNFNKLEGNNSPYSENYKKSNENNNGEICTEFDLDKIDSNKPNYACENGYKYINYKCVKITEIKGTKRTKCPAGTIELKRVSDVSANYTITCQSEYNSLPTCKKGYVPVMKGSELVCAKCKDGSKKVTTTTTNVTNVTTNRVEDITDCDSGVYNLLRKYWKIIMIFSPVILILMTTLDFFKAIVSSDSDKLKKASSDALKRTLAYVILVLLPFIISTIFSWVGVTFCL